MRLIAVRQILYSLNCRMRNFPIHHLKNVGYRLMIVHKLTCSIQPFKCRVSVVARALFSLNTNCGTMFILSNKMDVD